MMKKSYFLMVLLLAFSIESGANQPASDSILLNTENPDALMPTYGNWCGANHPENIEEAKSPSMSLTELAKDTICVTNKKDFYPASAIKYLMMKLLRV